MAKHSRSEHAESDNDTIYVSASSEYELEDEFEDISIPLTSNDITEDRTDDPPDGALQDVALPSAHEEPVLFTPRSYQIEMFEESLRRNIIVAMDTGSGKTQMLLCPDGAIFCPRSVAYFLRSRHIFPVSTAFVYPANSRPVSAILRIQKELEHATSGKIIWFLATTVALCLQQYQSISSQITAAKILFLSGADNVERWTTQLIWDSVLKGVNIVVSTHDILLDALTHAFVKIERLSLLIFDEAHHCVGKYPGAQIMSSFYNRNAKNSQPVPRILGLSASPIMNNKMLSLQSVEEILDSICVTPVKHKAELAKYVNIPELCQTIYQKPIPEIIQPIILSSLERAYRSMDILNDPYICELRASNTERAKRQLIKAVGKQSTWCMDQMRLLCLASKKILEDLGEWAVEFYITEAISRYLRSVEGNEIYFGETTNEEKTYLATFLSKVEGLRSTGYPDPTLISDKVAKFIDSLPQEAGSAGIVFVERRATVAVLAKLLSRFGRTKHLRIATMVGTSQSSQRMKNIGDLLDPGEHQDTLEKFRAQQLDLIIATSVLEEGIDIPACNTVICFDPPANLKSFVQRRGRARAQKSKLVLLQWDVARNPKAWQDLEAEMKKIYSNDMRKLRAIEEIDDLEEHDSREFRIESTGALLTLDNAVSHLYHFCAVLPANAYVDLRPEFIFNKGETTQVILPLSVDQSVRTARSQHEWKSERNGVKDAAFEAYVALYRAGLVNENLLPLIHRTSVEGELVDGAVEKRPSLVEAKALHEPWRDIAKAWIARDSGFPTATIINLKCPDLDSSPKFLITPTRLPKIPQFTLFWDEDTALQATMTGQGANEELSSENCSKHRTRTTQILTAAFRHRFQISSSDFVALIGDGVDSERYSGQPEAVKDPEMLLERGESLGLIWDKQEPLVRYVYRGWLDHKPLQSMVKHPYIDYESIAEDAPHLIVSRLTRRDNFLHPIQSNHTQKSEKQYSYVLPAHRCMLDPVPFRDIQFALLYPSIMYVIETYLVAETLSKTLLANIGYKDLSLVLTALTASSASGKNNYQRLEFLGDSILKTCTSIQLVSEHLAWHEGYLSAMKDRIVANSRLARAALEFGLDRYIITKAFTGKKWRPQSIHDLLSNESTLPPRKLSTKVLADVVESLIGAAMLDGGFPKALDCLSNFLPEIKWQPLSMSREIVYSHAPSSIPLPLTFAPVESLIGYTFTKKVLLIEAMTHASYNLGMATYERLEFLGDSILDNLIVEAIYHQEPPLSHVQMHRLRTAFVNADFLAHICMEWCTEIETTHVVKASTGSTGYTESKFSTEIGVSKMPLWKFMRHTSPKIGRLQRAIATKHALLRDQINTAIESGTHYPWTLLARMQMPKFYSDLVEALLGAVYIDSGSWGVCEAVLERMGILKYLRRALKDGIELLHPKEAVGIIADAEKVRYVLGVETSEWVIMMSSRHSRERSGGSENHEEQDILGKDGRKRYKCELWIGERKIVTVGYGVNKEEVKIKAAEEAVRLLKDEGLGVTVHGVKQKGDAKSGIDRTPSEDLWVWI